MARDVGDWIVEEPWILAEEVEEYQEEVTDVTSSERHGDIVSTRKKNSTDTTVGHPMVELQNTETGETYEFSDKKEASDKIIELEDEQGVVLIPQERIDHMEIRFEDDNSGDEWIGIYEENY